MENEIKKPIATENQLEYLDNLRESGITNMFNAGTFLVDEYDIKLCDANNILKYWMESFSIRHNKIKST